MTKGIHKVWTKEFLLFSALGASAFILEFSFFNGLVVFGLADKTVSNLFAVLTANMFSLFANLWVTFRHRELNLSLQLALRFATVAAVTIFANQTLFVLFLTLMPGSSLLVTNLAKVTIIASLALGRFLLYRNFVYRH